MIGDTTQKDPYARFQLSHVKGFNHVVVRAVIEALNSAQGGIAGGEYQDRDIAAACAYALQHLFAGQARYAQVEHNQIISFRTKPEVGIFAVVSALYGVTIF